MPGTENFLINPYGVLFHEVSASCLIKVDLSGDVILDPTGIGANPAGFLIQVACTVHRAPCTAGPYLRDAHAQRVRNRSGGAAS